MRSPASTNVMLPRHLEPLAPMPPIRCATVGWGKKNRGPIGVGGGPAQPGTSGCRQLSRNRWRGRVFGPRQRCAGINDAPRRSVQPVRSHPLDHPTAVPCSPAQISAISAATEPHDATERKEPPRSGKSQRFCMESQPLAQADSRAVSQGVPPRRAKARHMTPSPPRFNRPEHERRSSPPD